MFRDGYMMNLLVIAGSGREMLCLKGFREAAERADSFFVSVQGVMPSRAKPSSGYRRSGLIRRFCVHRRKHIANGREDLFVRMRGVLLENLPPFRY